MLVRALTLAAGLTGAGIVSQFPEFSQQYVRRLGGTVDALDQVVKDFDASAAAEGLSRQDALAQMVGAGFVERRRADMEQTFTRHAILVEDLAAARASGPFMRAYHVTRVDSDIAAATWQDFEPAVPLNTTGAIFAGVGFLLGGIVIAFLRALLWAPVSWVLRARKQASA